VQKEIRFKIMSECISNGVSVTCKKYNISRTIYYRWLKRYKSLGIDGLNDVKKDFIPLNKTNPEIEKAIMNLIMIYPNYGPTTLNYLLQELGYNISESAVFNILKRHQLTNKWNRIKLSKEKEINIAQSIPAISELKSGEYWMFWITDLGTFNNQNIYTYTFFDIKSRIACTRLYINISLEIFEEVLTAVALSVATTLNLKISNLCFFKNGKLLNQYKNSFKPKICNILKEQGRDIKINILSTDKNINKINMLKKQYTNNMILVLMSILSEEKTFSEIKINFQVSM